MTHKQFRRYMYRLKHDYLTTNNIVMVVAGFIALSWAWSSVQMVQRNYTLQQDLDDKKRQRQIAELETKTLEYEQRYYKSTEYLELEVRQRLGLAAPGEKILMLPANTERAKQFDAETTSQTEAQAASPQEASNFTQWTNFLFGGVSRGANIEE